MPEPGEEATQTPGAGGCEPAVPEALPAPEPPALFTPAEGPAPVPPPSARAYPSVLQALGLVGLVMLLQFSTMLGLMLLVMLRRALANPSIRPEELLATMPLLDPLALALVNLLSVGGAALVGMWLGGKPYGRSFPFRRVRPLLLLPMALSVAGGVAVLSELHKVVGRVLPMPDWFGTALQSLTGGEVSVIGSAVALVLVAPVSEEILFRGVILNGFLRRYSPRRAIVASAVLFGVVHGNPWQLLDAFALGLLFGWWTYRTRSLAPALLGHVAVNGSAMLASVAAGAAGRPELPEAAMPFAPWWLTAAALATAAVGIALSGRMFAKQTDVG